MAEADRLTNLKFSNGMRFYCLPSSQSEARFIYSEIFEQETYLQNGISIEDGQTIVDVGGNVGMFVHFAMQKARDLHIFCLEPTPPIIEALKKNVQRHQADYSGIVEVFPVGISDANSWREITFFSRAPGNSTLYIDEKQEEAAVTADTITVRDVWQYDKLAFLGLICLYPFRRSLIRSRLRKLYRKQQKFRCEFVTLSYFIEEQNIDAIDLLKIDVEGSELDVLAGINDEHWDRIQQMVIEIAPANCGTIRQLQNDLATRGFKNICVQTMGHAEYLEGNRYPCTLYATRSAVPAAKTSVADADREVASCT